MRPTTGGQRSLCARGAIKIRIRPAAIGWPADLLDSPRRVTGFLRRTAFPARCTRPFALAPICESGGRALRLNDETKRLSAAWALRPLHAAVSKELLGTQKQSNVHYEANDGITVDVAFSYFFLLTVRIKPRGTQSLNEDRRVLTTSKSFIS